MKDFLLKRRRIILILTPAFLGMLFMILCIANLQQSVNFEESYSAYLTRFDLGGIWKYAAAETNPPLYYFALKAWAAIIGHHDYVLRMLSVLFGAVTILFVFLWLKYKYGLKAAIIATSLLSISPIFVRFGQEMRMYTMLAAIVFASTYFLQLAIDNKKRKWWITYAILIALGLWTHYYMIFALVAHLIYLLVVYKKQFWKKKAWVPFLIAFVSFLPWLPNVITQAQRIGNSGTVDMTGISNYLSEVLYYAQVTELHSWLLVLAIITIVAIIFLTVRFRKKMILMLLLALMPVVFLFGLSLLPFGPVFRSKHILYSAITIPLIAGIGIAMLLNESKKKKGKKHSALKCSRLISIGCFAILVISSIIGLGNVYAKRNYDAYTDNMPESKNIFNTIKDFAFDDDIFIIVNSPELYYELATYTSAYYPVLFINEQMNYDNSLMQPLKESYFGRIDNFDKWSETHDRFWYVDEAPEENPYGSFLQFPYKGWRATTVLNKNYSENGKLYQILKFEKE